MDSATSSNPNTPQAANPVDELIVTKFKLFKGARSREEDQQIYDKVMDFCFEKTIEYLAENLSTEDFQDFQNKWKSQYDTEATSKIMGEYFQKIESFPASYILTMDNFLNDLVYNGMKSKINN